MFTTGFKYYFGVGLGLMAAAVVYGYTTGGTQTGPISMGWAGGVGDHFGYAMLLGLAVVMMTVGLVLVVFRDADPAAQSHYLGVDAVASAPRVTGNFWPVVGAFGVGGMAIGLVINTAVFITGLVLCAAVAFEWMTTAWADRATGDPAANRELRNRVMAPVEVPALGATAVALVVLAMSRILLAVSKNGAVVVAGVVAVLILSIAVLYAAKPNLGKNVVAGLVLVVGVAILAGGIVAAAIGERSFSEHDAGHEGAIAQIVDTSLSGGALSGGASSGGSTTVSGAGL